MDLPVDQSSPVFNQYGQIPMVEDFEDQQERHEEDLKQKSDSEESRKIDTSELSRNNNIAKSTSTRGRNNHMARETAMFAPIEAPREPSQDSIHQSVLTQSNAKKSQVAPSIKHLASDSIDDEEVLEFDMLEDPSGMGTFNAEVTITEEEKKDVMDPKRQSGFSFGGVGGAKVPKKSPSFKPTKAVAPAKQPKKSKTPNARETTGGHCGYHGPANVPYSKLAYVFNQPRVKRGSQATKNP